MSATPRSKWTPIQCDTATAEALADWSVAAGMTRPTFLRLLVEAYGERLARRHMRRPPPDGAKP